MEQALKQIYKSRSEMEAYQRCPRRWWYGYGVEHPNRDRELSSQVFGIQPRFQGFDMPIGSGVHAAFEYLLGLWKQINLDAARLQAAESKVTAFLELITSQEYSADRSSHLDIAVRMALLEFDKQVAAWKAELDARIAASSTPADEADPWNIAIGGDEDSLTPFAYGEALAMIEALIRAYVLAPSGLRWLLETYEVIAIEQEITVPIPVTFNKENWVLNFMGRPDAILRDRRTGEYYVLSVKTTKTWDGRKADLGRTDVQGISETFVGDYWLSQLDVERHSAMRPKIAGVQMVYLLKGKKYQDDYDGGTWKYNNGLINPWVKLAGVKTDIQLSWNWEGPDVNPKTGKLAGHTLGKGWARRPMWDEHMGGVRDWVHGIADQRCQLNGYTDSAGVPDYSWKHPLDAYVVNPVYIRNQDDIREWFESMIHQGTKMTRDAEVQRWADRTTPFQAPETGARERWETHRNQYFPKYRHSCNYPVRCEFFEVCHEGVDPLTSEKYRARVANHPQEGRGGEDA